MGDVYPVYLEWRQIHVYLSVSLSGSRVAQLLAAPVHERKRAPRLAQRLGTTGAVARVAGCTIGRSGAAAERKARLGLGLSTRGGMGDSCRAHLYTYKVPCSNLVRLSTTCVS